MKMNSSIVFTLCSIAILLLVISTSVTIADDQYYPPDRKVSNDVWLSAYGFRPWNKRGRFVFREAHKERYHEPISDRRFINDGQDDDSSVDKRNWRF